MRPAFTNDEMENIPGTVSQTNLPICVDLDGTLIQSDLLLESLVNLLRERPLQLAAIPGWLLSGKAYLKSRLAVLSTVDVTTLPYNWEVISWLRQEKESGRTVILATAANEALAFAVSEHLKLFDRVLASSNRKNLKGINKLEAIRAETGPKFSYVGDSAADLPIMEASQEKFWVQSKWARTKSNPLKFLRVFAKQLRVHQWAKNLLIFLPLIGAHELFRPDLLMHAVVAFFAFSLVASSVYVLNDLADLKADRVHVRKRERPLASGSLPLWLGLCLIPALLGGGLALAFSLNVQCGMLIVAYFLLTTAYSFAIKRVMFYDVLTLALLYVSRLFAGQTAYDITVSTWLLSCCFFLFLSLAFCKRASELVLKAQETSEQPLVDERIMGRGYQPSDLLIVCCFGIGCGMLASLITVLYVESENVTKLYRHPDVLWLTCPLLLQWIARLWTLAYHGKIVEDPVLFSLKERSTWITLLVGLVLLIGATV